MCECALGRRLLCCVGDDRESSCAQRLVVRAPSNFQYILRHSENSFTNGTNIICYSITSLISHSTNSNDRPKIPINCTVCVCPADDVIVVVDVDVLFVDISLVASVVSGLIEAYITVLPGRLNRLLCTRTERNESSLSECLHRRWCCDSMTASKMRQRQRYAIVHANG